MIKNPTILSVIRIVLLLCTPFLLLLSNLYLVATPAFIRYEYSKPQFPPAEAYDAMERLSLAEATLHYLRSNAGVDYLRKLQSQGQLVYNAREITHLVDVKRVMSGAFWAHGICAFLCVTALIVAWRRGEWLAALQAVYLACLALLVALGVIGIFAYASFDVFFTVFHRLFFAGDSWLFAYSDSLIQLFPVPFWMDATWALTVLTVGECISVGALAYALFRRQKGVR